MTVILYGRPPAVFEPPADAVQTSPLIPGSADIADMNEGSVDAAVILAPPGAIERRHVLALALRALAPGGRLDVMAPKDKGGARLLKELRDFGVEAEIVSKTHHKRALAVRPEGVTGLDEAIAAGALQQVKRHRLWSQPGVFSWDRIDPGTELLSDEVTFYQGVGWWIEGAGADLGCGVGPLSVDILDGWSKVTSLRLIDLDRRAIAAAKRNIKDPRATFEWADVRTLEETADLDFVVMNPPFHDGGAEDRALGQAFIRKAAGLLKPSAPLKPGGVLYMTANRHLPYEAVLNAVFHKVRLIVEKDGYKVFEAMK